MRKDRGKLSGGYTLRFRDKWAELLILIIMIPALVALLKIGWTLETRTAGLEARMKTFAKDTAELRVGIAAAAAVNQTFQSAIVVFQPEPKEDDWLMKVEVWDATEGKFSIFTAQLDDRRKQLLDAGLVASIKRVDLDALNFREMQEMARIVGIEERTLPRSIDRDDSFIVYAAPKEIEKELQSFGFQIIETRSAKGVNTWPALNEALERMYRGR